MPKGTIQLDVTFGDAKHFLTETIEFEVVDWKSQYHAILGRPAFARFMVVPHYAYLKLKMPGPKGVITVNGNFQRSDTRRALAHQRSNIHARAQEAGSRQSVQHHR